MRRTVAPVQADDPPSGMMRVDWRRSGHPGCVSGWIDWDEHEEAWQDYSERYGRDQGADRIAERGGFSYGELVRHLGRTPLTWRPR